MENDQLSKRLDSEASSTSGSDSGVDGDGDNDERDDTGVLTIAKVPVRFKDDFIRQSIESKLEILRERITEKMTIHALLAHSLQRRTLDTIAKLFSCRKY